MNPDEASRLYHYFVEKVRQGYQAERVKDGKFQAMMEVALVNDGPVSTLQWSNLFLNTIYYLSRDLVNILCLFGRLR